MCCMLTLKAASKIFLLNPEKKDCWFSLPDNKKDCWNGVKDKSMIHVKKRKCGYIIYV